MIQTQASIMSFMTRIPLVQDFLDSGVKIPFIPSSTHSITIGAVSFKKKQNNYLSFKCTNSTRMKALPEAAV